MVAETPAANKALKLKLQTNYTSVEDVKSLEQEKLILLNEVAQLKQKNTKLESKALKEQRKLTETEKKLKGREHQKRSIQPTD